MEKERLDLLVVQQGLTDSREKAKRLIMAGQIYDENNQRYDKPGEKNFRRENAPHKRRNIEIREPWRIET